MKTERRHELQKNVLADWLGENLETARPYTKILLGLVIATAALALAWYIVARQQQSRVATQWEGFYSALNTADSSALLDVAERYGDSPAGLWARQTAADMDLAQGTNDLYRDRESALKSLKKAREGYEVVLEETSPGTMLYSRARFGLAQALESLGELEPAVNLYKEIAEQDQELAPAARERLAQLRKPSVQKFYDEFADYVPPADSQQGTTGSSQLDELPDLPDFGLLPGEGAGSTTPGTNSFGLPTIDPPADPQPGAAPSTNDAPLNQDESTEPASTESSASEDAAGPELNPSGAPQ